MFARIFGGGKPGRGAHQAPSSPADALAKLQETVELLQKKQELLEAKVEEQQELAKQHAREKRDKAALAAIRARRMYEGQLGQLEQHLARLRESQIMLENASTLALAAEALRVMDAASKFAMAGLDVDEVGRLKDDIAERMDYMNQVGDLLAAPMGTCADVDDDDLMEELQGLKDEAAHEDEGAAAELAALQAEVSRAARADLPSAPRMPRAQRAAQQQTAEERELAELKAELAA